MNKEKRRNVFYAFGLFFVGKKGYNKDTSSQERTNL